MVCDECRQAGKSISLNFATFDTVSHRQSSTGESKVMPLPDDKVIVSKWEQIIISAAGGRVLIHEIERETREWRTRGEGISRPCSFCWLSLLENNSVKSFVGHKVTAWRVRKMWEIVTLVLNAKCIQTTIFRDFPNYFRGLRWARVSVAWLMVHCHQAQHQPTKNTRISRKSPPTRESTPDNGSDTVEI